TPELDDGAVETARADPAGQQRRLVAALIVAGIVLVCGAGAIAEALLPKTAIGPGGALAWSPQTEEAYITTIRLLGTMAFAAGLVERLALAIGRARNLP